MPRFVIDMIYTFYMTYVICHEFWGPERPTQNCADMIVLYLHVILFTVFDLFWLEAMLCHEMRISVL